MKGPELDLGSPRRRFAVALLPPFVALGVQLALWSLITPYVWFLFFPAVFLSSWLGGRRAGLIATVNSVVIVWFCFVAPRYAWGKGSMRPVFPLIVFSLMGVAFSTVHERLRRSNLELRQTHARVAALLEQSLELDRAKSELFANVSHELRTPLTLILGSTRLLLEAEQLPASTRERLQVVERNGQVLQRLVEELLEGAALEEGRARLQLVPTDLAGLVSLVGSQFLDLATERGLTLTVDVPESLPALIDPDKLQRAVTNLLANAVKFTPSGGVVRVRALRDGEQGVVEVADSGPGVAAEHAERLFERFQQLESSSTRRYGGVGLGLAIVREIATLHGGSVSVGRAVEGGALFRLVLPLRPAEHVALEPGQLLVPVAGTAQAVAELRDVTVQLEEAVVPSFSPFGVATVLVVEDNPELNAFVCGLLRAEGFEVVSAPDGQSGLALAEERQPSVVVTDLMMPGLSGEDFVQALREQEATADVPILVLTARDQADVRVRLLEAGANDYVVKPFRSQELCARVVNLAKLRLLDETRRRAHDRAEGLLEAAPDSTLVVDASGSIVHVNRQAAVTFGYSVAELVGQQVEVLIPMPARERHPHLREEFGRNPQPRTMGSGIELYARRKDGSLLPVDVSLSPVMTAEGVLTIAAVRDVSRQRSVQEELRRLALHDALTGLPNRLLFVDHVDTKLAELQRHGGCVAVLFVDLDRFKFVNDQHGHGVGDAVLVEVAARLRAAVRPEDTVARLGGDEFVVACVLPDDEREALVVASRVLAAFEQPMALEELSLQVSVSVGLAVARSGADATELLKHADTAMYRAKERGRSRVEVFEQSLAKVAQERSAAELLLREALRDDRFVLHYQPMVDLRTLAVVGVEALLRVRAPDGRLVGPEEFLAVAEESGLILPMGRWVVQEAYRQLVRWGRSGFAPRVWLNVSGRQLGSGELAAFVLASAREANAPVAQLGLELTETAFMQATPGVIEELGRLRGAGVGLAIDDFGTGWSSLTYLKDLPVDTIKVDRTFTSGLGRRSEDTAIVSAIVTLAQVLDRRVVIEGVETEEQLALCRDLCCDFAQGFLFARALAPEDVVTWAQHRAGIALPAPRVGVPEDARPTGGRGGER